MPDCWIVTPTAYRDAAVARFGNASLRLQGTASQVVYLCGETDPRDGGAHYNAFRPLPAALSKTIEPRPLRFGAWCKTQDAMAQPGLSVIVEYSQVERITTRTFTVSFGKGTHDWEYREVTVAAAPTSACPTPLSCG